MNHHFGLRGSERTINVVWSLRSDGPMNIIGREYPSVDPSFPSWKMEAGDQERMANRAQFLKREGVGSLPLCVPKLFHGNDIKYVNEANRYIEDLSCDGLMTERRNLVLSVGFADCPSVAIMAPEHELLIVLHAGWRGIAANIIERAVASMRQFGVPRSDIHAVIGPGARGCCYEVGPDVATKVDALPHYGHVKIDLPNHIGFRLSAAGVPRENINDELAACTICTTVDSREGKKPAFYSFRRDKKNTPLDTGCFFAWMS